MLHLKTHCNFNWDVLKNRLNSHRIMSNGMAHMKIQPIKS